MPDQSFELFEEHGREASEARRGKLKAKTAKLRIVKASAPKSLEFSGSVHLETD